MDKRNIGGVDNEVYQRVYSKILNFLSYKYRSSHEIDQKLSFYISKEKISLQEKEELKDRILNVLDEDGYIDDIRFAKAYVDSLSSDKKLKSKFSIKRTLLSKRIEEDIIDRLIDTLDDQYEKDAVKSVAEKKLKTLSKYNGFEKKRRLGRYLIGKGYSSDIIYSVIDSLIDMQ